jgi:hypothetical protein
MPTNAIYFRSRPISIPPLEPTRAGEETSKKSFGRGGAMIGIVGLFSVVTGAVVAYASDRFPSRREALETAAGVLVLGGFSVAGYALSNFVIV